MFKRETIVKSLNENIFYVLIVLAMAGWGISWVNAKVLSSYLNEYEFIFFKNAFVVFTLIPIVFFQEQLFLLIKKI